ncbi:MAG: LysR family transcriptional regulator [Granulosicoccus sp.]
MRHIQQLVYIDTVARTGSIRRAALSLAITSTALNRRILALEEDLGTPIFERTGKGVRLSVAGEVFIHHVRQQMSDMERVKSQIADLHGERRGQVSIACGQALMQDFLPQLVSRYRAEHPYVDFSVGVCGRHEASDRLLDFSADIAVIFDPDITADVSVLAQVPQAVYAVMSSQHPLAKKPMLTLSDCSQYPLAVPSRRSGLRALIERAAMKLSVKLWTAVESDSLDFLLKGLDDHRMIGFQISVACARSSMPDGVVAVKICTRDLSSGSLVVLQQKGRTLPVAAARFLAQLIEQLSGSVSCQSDNAQSLDTV